MVKYLKRKRYEELRRVEGLEVFKPIMAKVLRDNGIKVDQNVLQRIVRQFLIFSSYQLFKSPDVCYDFGPYVLFRESSDRDNLITVEAVEPHTAETLYNYIKKGGLEIEELSKLTAEYMSTIAEQAMQDSTRLNKGITEIQSRTSAKSKG